MPWRRIFCVRSDGRRPRLTCCPTSVNVACGSFGAFFCRSAQPRVSSFITFSILDAVDGGFVCYPSSSRLPGRYSQPCPIPTIVKVSGLIGFDVLMERAHSYMCPKVAT